MRWQANLEFPIFPGSPGKVTYEEIVEALDRDEAYQLAAENFKKKVGWVITNQWKSFGGEVRSIEEPTEYFSVGHGGGCV